MLGTTLDPRSRSTYKWRQSLVKAEPVDSLLQAPESSYGQSIYPMHPACVDGCFQTVSPALWEGDRTTVGAVLVPAVISRLVITSQEQSPNQVLRKNTPEPLDDFNPVDSKRPTLTRQQTLVQTSVDLIAHKYPKSKILEVKIGAEDAISVWLQSNSPPSNAIRDACSRYHFASTDPTALVAAQDQYSSRAPNVEFTMIYPVVSQEILNGVQFDLAIVTISPSAPAEVVRAAVASVHLSMHNSGLVLNEDPSARKTKSVDLYANNTCIRLCAGRLSNIDSVDYWELPVDSLTLPGGFVEVEIFAAGMNYKDVVVTVGIVPGNEHTLGGEGAGVITRISPEVTSFAVGQRVVVFDKGTFGRTDICHGWNRRETGVPQTNLRALG
ncbi:hypothetical protein PENFLA_c009G05555 [Penicillium flavigenum]|uniref:Enoyl reductase (ER) domain-containing protein n=1 Tax=Penicillium flavigenum TaxID=254877 RepID=A0A1V6TFP6_9EURO|nr:hypothetical protein PENFLA_c009G05555 [Penicillium flavigenum]